MNKTRLFEQDIDIKGKGNLLREEKVKATLHYFLGFNVS